MVSLSVQLDNIGTIVNTPTAHLTVKAQVYITGTGGVAHACHAGVRYRCNEKNVKEGKDGRCTLLGGVTDVR
jgi:hypothetical protein